MKVKSIIKKLRRRIKGNLAITKENGMIVESGVTVMGG